MNYVVVLVEHHVRIETPQFALERKQVMGQRQDGDLMPERSQHACHVADHMTQVRGAAAVFRRVRDDARVGIVHQRHVEGFARSSGSFGHMVVLVLESVVQGRFLGRRRGHAGLVCRRSRRLIGTACIRIMPPGTRGVNHVVHDSRTTVLARAPRTGLARGVRSALYGYRRGEGRQAWQRAWTFRRRRERLRDPQPK